jgi:hypothetical protein
MFIKPDKSFNTTYTVAELETENLELYTICKFTAVKQIARKLAKWSSNMVCFIFAYFMMIFL